MTREPVATSCYLYGVARPGSEGLVEGLRGVADLAVRTLRDGGLAAVVSEVPAHDFTEQALRARLEDLPQLEALARAHHAVVDALAEHTTVLPLRLATLYHNEQRVREVLRERNQHFETALGMLADRKEWGVKVYAAGPVPAAVSRSAAPAPRSGETSGRDYLQQRLRQRRKRDDGRRHAGDLSLRVDAELSALADRVRHHRPQDPRLSGARGENVLNAAYLVVSAREEDFVARVRELGAWSPEVRVELTGPWAPYSFTPADPVGDPAGAGGVA